MTRNRWSGAARRLRSLLRSIFVATAQASQMPTWAMHVFDARLHLGSHFPLHKHGLMHLDPASPADR